MHLHQPHFFHQIIFMRSYTLLFHPLLVCCFIFARDMRANAQSFSFSGKITDNITHIGLPGATIKIGKDGCVADKKGYFSIITDSAKLTKYGIDFSNVGYTGYHIAGIPADDFLIITLTKSAGVLPEVVVGSSARAIVEKAIAAIPLNYPTAPFNLKGINRIYESINDSDYFYASDALLNFYYTSYTRPSQKTQVAIEQNRSDSVNNIIMKKNIIYSLLKPHQDIPVYWIREYYLLSKLDYLRRRIYFFDPKQINNYNFFTPLKIIYGRHKVYAIDFAVKEGRAGAEGSVFIDTATYAFAGISFTANQNGLDKVNAAYTNHKKTFLYWSVNYQEINGKWYFRDGHTEQHVIWHKHWGKDTYSQKAFMDFATLSIDTINVQSIPVKDRVKKDDRAIDVHITSDINKWKEIDSLLNGGWLSQYISTMPMPAKREVKNN